MQLHGLKLDNKFGDAAHATWAYAKNILLSKGFDSIKNEPGDIWINTQSGAILGRIIVPNAILLFVWDDNYSNILYIDENGTSTELINGGTEFLDFNPTTIPYKYVEGVYCYNNSGELIIAWTLGVGKPMILNITQAMVSPLTISSADDLKELYLFPEFNHNNFVVSNTPTPSIISGGKLPSAAYFISLTYELTPDVNTNFGVISNPIFITEDDSITSYRQFKGNTSLVRTNKAIIVNITDLDISRDYFKLAIIQKTTTSTITYLTKRIKVQRTPVSVLIDDLDKLILFDIVNVVTSSPAYINVKSITNINKRLRLGGLDKPTKIPLSQIYNDIFSPREIAVQSASRTGTTVNIYCNEEHHLSDNDVVYMSGWNITAYNGYFKINVWSNVRFTYDVITSATDIASGGTCKVERLSVEWINERTASLSNIKNSYKDSVFIFNSKGFRSDEVYALYLGLKLKTGGYYGIYHIPGRDIIGNEATRTITVDGESLLEHKVDSTATLLGNYYGKMGYWQNENEVYPVEYGNYAGRNVRHHRFPSAGQIHNWKSGLVHNTEKGNIADNFNFTVSLLDDGTNVFYGSLSGTPNLGTLVSGTTSNPLNRYTASYRQIVNISFNAYFLTDNTGVTSEASITIYKNGVSVGVVSKLGDYSPDNINLTISREIELAKGDYIDIELRMVTFHDPSGFMPTITFSSISGITIYESTAVQEVLGLRIKFDFDNIPFATKNILLENIDSWEIFYAKRTLKDQLMLDQSIAIQDGVGYRFHGFDSMASMLNIEPTHIKSELLVNPTDYSLSTYVNEVFNYSREARKISKLKSIKYLPAYNSATVPNNEVRENCYYFETLSNTFHLRLVNFLNVKNNVYLDFSSQELISTGVVKRLSQTSSLSFYGGDNYIGHNSVLTFNTAGTAKVWYFPIESILNSGMRYEGLNDHEKFYPATDITAFFTIEGSPTQKYLNAMKEAGVANYYFYNSDFHLLNNFRQDIIDNETMSTNTHFPNRIHSSMPQVLQSDSIYWRKFMPLDYFDMVNHKGPIYKMLGNEYIIYIQTQYSIFRGIIVDQLDAINISVGLKTTEIFDRPLQELLDADGVYIQPWNREGTILTPFGLVVVDIHKGSIYIISDKLNEISKLGIEDWFRKTIKNRIRFEDKEKIGTGVSLGYDDLYKRLLVTIKDKSFTFANKLGFLYNWYAVNDPRQIYADGWNVPDLGEWITLSNYLGTDSVSGGVLKETGSLYWNEPNTNGTNAVGFNGRGGGNRNIDGIFENINVNAVYHILGNIGGNDAKALMLYYNTSGITTFSYADGKKLGMSVRLFRSATIEEQLLSDGTACDSYIGNDNKVYRTIKIGNQVWLDGNLCETQYRNGEYILEVTNDVTWKNLTSGARCSYANDIDNAYSVIGYRNSFTLSFSFEKMMWLCFHDYIFDKYCWNSKGLFGINDSNIYKLLSNNKGYYNNRYYPSTIDFIFANNTIKRFLLENINWITTVEQNGVLLWNETINSLFVYSKHFATLINSIVKKEYSYNINNQLQESGTALYQDGRWIFNDIKNYLVNLTSRILDENFNIISDSLDDTNSEFNLSKFITEYAIVRMIYENTDNKDFSIDDIQISIKKVLQ